MQVTAAIQAAQGHLMNADDGINVQANIKKALAFLAEAQQVNRYFVKDSRWE